VFGKVLLADMLTALANLNRLHVLTANPGTRFRSKRKARRTKITMMRSIALAAFIRPAIMLF